MRKRTKQACCLRKNNDRAGDGFSSRRITHSHRILLLLLGDDDGLRAAYFDICTHRVFLRRMSFAFRCVRHLLPLLLLR